MRLFHTLEVNLNYKQIPRHRKQRKYPDLLTKDEIQNLLNACDNLRDKCILMTIYGAGLRLSEVACLKVADIDSQKMQLLICNGKGAKDRYAILSNANLEILRDYWKAYRPKEWLFYSRINSGTHITPRGVANIFTKYKNITGITKDVSTHTLRHCFSTHLLESGYSIFHIKQLLGHSDISTTCFYLHLIKIQYLMNSNSFNKFLTTHYDKEWIIYCKPPFKNSTYVVEYLGRYTHRVAISNTRIVNLENGCVTFKWRDYKDSNKQKLMTISAEEFIRRFLIHILPDRLMKIRHYGLLGNRNKNTKLKLCKQLTNTPI